MRDTLSTKINNVECGVVNLDTLVSQGTHWTAYYKKGKQCIYFDSLGLPPPKEVETYLAQPYVYQTFQLQDYKDAICGHLCLYVLRNLAAGTDFKCIILNII